jgi:hypothetical protein
MANLYELSAEYAGFLDAYANAQNEEEAAEILQSLVDIHGELTEKAENYVRVIKNVQSDVDGYKAEAKRLTAKAKAGENLIDRLKNAMLDAMKLTDTPTIQTSIGKWRLQPNPYKCVVTDWTKLPMEFREPQPDKVDSKGIIAHYKATGEVFDGCEVTREMGVRFQ